MKGFKMKVLLINPPVREHYPPESFPFGLSYVAKYLIKAGHEVEILDIDNNRYSREEVLKKLNQHKCDVIGTGGIITVYKYLKWLVPVLRKNFPKTKIIVGGSLATSAPEDTLKGLDIDFIVIGEGEITAPELVSYLERQKKNHKSLELSSLKQIKGIGFRQGKKIIITEPRELIQNLDEIGLPEWELFSMKKMLKQKHNIMTILTERGCPFRCEFCYHQFGYKPRRRSMESVVQEMKILNEKYGVSVFSIADNLFVFNKKEVLELIRLLRKNKLKIKFDTSMRASLVTEELIKLLQKAGCTSLNFGFESGSQKVLDLMNKMTKVEQMDRAIEIMEKNKMKYFGTFIIGYPGETKEDVDQTIAFCKRHGHLAKPFFATPYPGTPLYDKVKNKIKNMDKFLESLGDARDLAINISEFSTKELLKQRRRVIEETEKAYLQNHKVLGFLFSPLKLLNIEVGFAVYAFRNTPFLSFMKMSAKTAWGYIKGKAIVPLSDEGYDKTKE
jgi:anaerobic magnesium-protoporphyrin IX monomethyl ester cyclase